LRWYVLPDRCMIKNIHKNFKIKILHASDFKK
jgi:hypothetical protein